MSVLSDLYVSAPDLAIDYDDLEAQQTFPDSDREQFKGLTVLELSTLWAIIRKKSWDVSQMRGFEKILMRDGGERLIYRLPDAFLSVVSDLDDPAAGAAAEKWAQTDELRCAAADVRPVIDALGRLAGVARQSGRGVYIWNCL